MIRSQTIFWPITDQSDGFVFGWKNTDNIVVAGTLVFNDESLARTALSRMNSIPFQSLANAPPLELLVVNSSRDDTEATRQNGTSADQKEAIFYQRPKHGSMRHYSLVSLNLDLLLTIPSSKNSPPLESRHSEFLASQTCFTEKRTCSQKGIDSSIVNQMNSADRVMNQLKRGCGSLSGSTSSGSPTTRHSPRVVKRFCKNSADLLDSLRLSYFYGAGPLVCSFINSAQQLDLRCEQIIFVLRQAWLLDRRKETSNNEFSTHYISTQNCIWLILNDMIIGSAVGVFLMDNNKYLARAINDFVETWTVSAIRQAVHWLDNWPAGLKLNTELSRFLFLVFNALLDSWEVVLGTISGLLPSIITVIGMSGMLGMTMILAPLSDLISLLSIHLSISYAITRVTFKTQLQMAKSLFNLFRGKRFNVLRDRVDDWDYDLDQLLLGAMLLTLINFLFPTVTVYYILFALTRLGVQILQAGLKIALALLNHFPLFALTLRIKDSRRLPGGIVFHPCRIQRNEQQRSFVVQNSPVTLSKIFGQYYVLGAKLGEHYNPSRLIMELLRGDPLDPIPHNSIRYTYRTHEPSD